MSNEKDNDGIDEDPRKNQMVRTGFDHTTMAHETPAMQAMIAKETAGVQARWILAMKRPRSLANVLAVVRQECMRPDFAKVAMYAVPRGGGTIRGLSIRFAEMVARAMTNLAVEATTLYDSDEERVIRVSVTDYETNVTWPRDITVKKTVERKQLRTGQRAIRARVNSYGEQVFIVEATDDDVATKEAAAISKAARTNILRVVPGDIQDEAKRIILKTNEDKAATDPQAAKKAMFEEFAKLNVLPNAIAEWLGHPVDQITPPEIVELQMLYRAIREGEMNWAEAREHADVLRARAKEVAKAVQPTKTSQPPAGATAPANDEKKAEAPKADKPATSTGKGAATTKEKIEKAKAADKAAEKPPAKVADKPAAPPPPLEQLPPKDGYEDRACSMCGVTIEVPVADPPGGVCYACANQE